MELKERSYLGDDDYWRMRNFLRALFLQRNSVAHGWHVGYLDHWRWHYIATCRECESVEKAVALWETTDGVLAAFLTAVCHDEVALHIDPAFHTPALEEAIIEYAEQHFSDAAPKGPGRILYVPLSAGDKQRREILMRRGYQKGPTWEHIWQRYLDDSIPEVHIPDDYVIRSMGDLDELPARSWCSWRTFHEDEPDENYDGDYSWYRNMQSAPLYRRDLDLVAAASDGSIAAFCTISYDDFTRSAFCVLGGTAAEHRGHHLDETLLAAGMHRLKSLGCKQLFAMATNGWEDVLYGSVMQTMDTFDIWIRKNF